MFYFLPKVNEIVSLHRPICETRIYMNLICCICKNEISEDAKIAKIISIKRIQHDGTGARTEYTNSGDEIYIHLNCLQCGNGPIIVCQANDKNFVPDSRIINNDTTLDSLVRSNILNF